MLSKTARTLSKALLGLSLVSVALVGCTASEPTVAPSDASGEGVASAQATPGSDQSAVPMDDMNTASQVVERYATAVRTKNAQGICDLLDPAVIKVALKNVDEGSTCVPAFETILQNSPDVKVPEKVDPAALAVQGTKVSETMYSFPLSAVTPDDPSIVFVTKVDNDWKIGLDPKQAEAVKQIEENNPTNSAPTSTPK